jgi:two-component system, LytTR family, sensor kinase
MNFILYRNWFNRLLFGALAGMVTWLLVEVSLNIRYRYFIFFGHPRNYFYAALFGVLIIESLYRTGLLIDKRHSWDAGPVKRFLLQCLAGTVIAILLVLVIRLLISYLLTPGVLFILSDEMITIALVIFFILVLNLVEYGTFLNERYRQSLAEIERFRKENAEYQFEMLKLQLNPHFLFNSLNTLSSLVHEDASKAADFTRRLSDVYRYVLENRNKELVALREELDFIKAFTFLQGLRFQGMIDFRFLIGDDMLERKIAPMTLQLLIENATKHNVVSRKMPLWIEVKTDSGSISVTNNLQLKEEQAGMGVGLKNISSRYDFLSGKKIEIIKDEHQFKVIIPLI